MLSHFGVFPSVLKKYVCSCWIQCSVIVNYFSLVNGNVKAPNQTISLKEYVYLIKKIILHCFWWHCANISWTIAGISIVKTQSHMKAKQLHDTDSIWLQRWTLYLLNRRKRKENNSAKNSIVIKKHIILKL